MTLKTGDIVQCVHDISAPKNLPTWADYGLSTPKRGSFYTVASVGFLVMDTGGYDGVTLVECDNGKTRRLYGQRQPLYFPTRWFERVDPDRIAVLRAHLDTAGARKRIGG